ncbi:hypothetical protein HJFPF1_01661 [Paramyrothecium foliicola]|nr:hypothetical protein HJFPF1_01661 [Paramyrothecium foliicola]
MFRLATRYVATSRRCETPHPRFRSAKPSPSNTLLDLSICRTPSSLSIGPLVLASSLVPAMANTGDAAGAAGVLCETAPMANETTTGVIYYMCWQIWASFVLDSLLDWLDELEMNLSDKEKQELEELEEEPLFFLPFPFGIQSVEQPPYKGSDPEWQMFVKVNKDQKLQKEIRRLLTGAVELANVIRKSAEKNPALLSLLGKDTKVKKFWLDIIYPRAPPPKHYLSGLIIDDEGIFWGDRPVDTLAARQINAAIYPKAVVLTAWTFMNSLFTSTVQDIAEALGLKTTESSDVSWQSVAMDRMKGGFGPGPGPANDQAVKVSDQTDKSASLGLPTGTGSALSNPFLPEFQGDARIQAAIRAAAVTFVKNWRPSPAPPARGCIRVDGVVELQGKRALLAVYVLGWYDPNQKKYVSVESKVKHLLPLNQKPAKG